MASTLPPVKGATFNFPVSLVSQGDTDIFQTNVTITTADVWVSKDGGAFVAAAAAPTELLTGAAAKTGVLWQNLTAAEMNADVVTVLYHDAAGTEWQDALVTIYTVAQTLDTTDGVADTISGKVIGTLAAGTHNAQSGDGYAIVNHATYGNNALNTDIDAILEDTGTTLDDLVDDLETRLSALRAGYLDSLSAGVPTAAAIATAVWAATTRTLSSFGTLVTDITAALTASATYLAATAAAVWAYATRTLTQSAASVTSTVQGTTLTAIRGDTFTAALTGLGNISTRSKLWFTVKVNDEDVDTAALIQIEETAGLLYLNGAAALTAANGSIMVSNAITGALTITLKPAETDDLHQCTAKYDVQMLTSVGMVTTLTSGIFDVVLDQTRVVA
jgi:hypothetical protein